MLAPAHASASEPPHRQERDDVDRALHGDVPPAFIENTTTTVERLFGGGELILQRGIAPSSLCGEPDPQNFAALLNRRAVQRRVRNQDFSGRRHGLIRTFRKSISDTG